MFLHTLLLQCTSKAMDTILYNKKIFIKFKVNQTIFVIVSVRQMEPKNFFNLDKTSLLFLQRLVLKFCHMRYIQSFNQISSFIPFLLLVQNVLMAKIFKENGRWGWLMIWTKAWVKHICIRSVNKIISLMQFLFEFENSKWLPFWNKIAEEVQE